LSSGVDWAAGRQLLTQVVGQRTSTGTDLPLTEESVRALIRAGEEATARQHNFIETRHLLLGILTETETDAAQFLVSNGIDRTRIGTDFQESPPRPEQPDALKGMTERIAELKRMGSGYVGSIVGGLKRDAAGRAEGRTSSNYHADGWRVSEAHVFHTGHQVTVVDRIRLSADGRTLEFSVEVTGPGGEVHRHTMNFPVDSGSPGSESGNPA
jgi:hypothetical protein